MQQQATPPTEPIRRPAYWLATLIAMWLVGVNAAQEGYGAIDLLRDPLTGNFGGSEDARNALVNALGEHSRVELPLAIAQLLLGGLLVFTATHLFLGGKPSLGFALQVLGANAALLIASYVLRESTRAAYISSLIEGSKERDLLYNQFWWRSRFVFAFDLTALALSVFALTRPAARRFLSLRAEPENQ